MNVTVAVFFISAFHSSSELQLFVRYFVQCLGSLKNKNVKHFPVLLAFRLLSQDSSWV